MCPASNDDNVLTTRERSGIETRLKNYNIPIQILQMVAQENNCHIDVSDQPRSLITKGSLERVLSLLDNKSLVKLQQIFLDCHDSLSHFRLAVYLSSKYSSLRYKFVINGNVGSILSGPTFFDVCIYSRETGSLVAVGGQNNDLRYNPASTASIQRFLGAIVALNKAAPTLRGAYYASSYGYNCDFRRLHRFWNENRKQNNGQDNEGTTELKFFEYKDNVYFEIESISHKN